MSSAVRWFAQHEPFTPIIDTLRGLLLGVHVGSSGPIAVAWCLGLALAGFLWARALFKRDVNLLSARTSPCRWRRAAALRR